MSDDSRLEGKIKRQITRFAGRLTDGWAKPLRRFVGEMLLLTFESPMQQAGRPERPVKHPGQLL